MEQLNEMKVSKMLKELNSLINVRNFLNLSINDFSVNMTSEKSNAVSKKIAVLNKNILDMALMLDVEKIVSESQREGTPIYSTVEVKTVDQLDKLAALGAMQASKSKVKGKAKSNEMAK